MKRGESYARNIGNKFDEAGSPRYFPGNTVISFIDRAAPVFSLFCRVRALLRESAADRCFAYLPDESIHMTVFEGVCDAWREPAVWTSLLPADAPLSAVDRLMEEAFAAVPAPGPIRMRAVGVKEGGGFALALEPADEGDARALRDYRDALSRETGIRFPGHDAYRYHISVCYGILPPSPGEDAALDAFVREADALIRAQRLIFPIQPPALTFFRSMFRFETARFARP